MTDKTREQMNVMGQTGAGVESEKEILPGTALKTKWGEFWHTCWRQTRLTGLIDEIKNDSPWFWEMCSLIGERPNLRPVGIGNNDDEMDLSLLLQSDGNDRPSSPEEFPAHLGFGDDDTDAMHAGADGADVDDSDSDSERPAKRKKAPTPDQVVVKKTKPQPAISAPTVKSASSKPAKPTTAKDKFTATVLAEEETEQVRLRLKKEQAKAKTSIALAQIDAAARVKIEKSKAKARVKGEEKIARLQLARDKIAQEHQFRMAQLHQSSHAAAGPSSMGRASFFDDVPSFSFHNLPSLGPSNAGSSSSSTPFALDPDLQLPLPNSYSSN